MSLENYSEEFYINILGYLGNRQLAPAPDLEKTVEECLDEVEKVSQFRYQWQQFDSLLPVLEKPAYREFLAGTSGYVLGVMTLGAAVDARSRAYSARDLARMCVFDAVANAYLEYCADRYEERFGENRTYRFCPGYRGTPVEDLKELFRILKPEKIGVSLLDSCLMVPAKSMLGIVGLGKQASKDCDTCALGGQCQYRREGRTCYGN